MRLTALLSERGLRLTSLLAEHKAAHGISVVAKTLLTSLLTERTGW